MSQLIADSHKFFLSPSGAQLKYNGSFNSYMTFNLPNAYKSSERVVYATARVLHAEIPNSFYIVNECNNALHTSFGTYNIPYGNYNANNLMTYLRSVFPGNISISFSNYNGKLTLSSPSTSFSILSDSMWYTDGIHEWTNVHFHLCRGSEYAGVAVSGQPIWNQEYLYTLTSICAGQSEYRHQRQNHYRQYTQDNVSLWSDIVRKCKWSIFGD